MFTVVFLYIKAFLLRHPEIVERTSEAVTAASSCVPEEGRYPRSVGRGGFRAAQISASAAIGAPPVGLRPAAAVCIEAEDLVAVGALVPPSVTKKTR